MFDIPSFADLNLGATLPALSLSLGLCILLLADVFLPKERRHITPWLALVGVAVSFVLNLFQFNAGGEALSGMFISDNFSAFVNMIALAAAFFSILLGIDYMRRQDIQRGEYYVLLLISTVGAMFMGSANDLVVVFVALEMLSIPLYIMAAFRFENAKSEEAGMKYFLLGAFASAFLVFGAALVYGATGTSNIPMIFERVDFIVSQDTSSVFYLLVGAALLIVGLGFKVAAVPFHMWTPDVYEGAPTPVTAFMSIMAKVGGFAALMRVLLIGLPVLVVNDDVAAAWQTSIWVISAVTMLVGNLVAISQTNIKRMLAYSSIANAGYILMAVAAAGTASVAGMATQSALVYLLAYTFTNVGAFAVVIMLERNDGTGTDIADFVGLSRTQPLLAMAMAIFMLSLTGIPLTAGFTGKWLVFQASLEAGLVPLAIIGVLTSVLSAYYYVRIIVNMYLVDGEAAKPASEHVAVSWSLYAALAATLLLGIFPTLVTNLAGVSTLVASVLP